MARRTVRWALTGVAGIAAVAAVLFFVFGARLENDGRGIPARVQFEQAEEHYEKLEANRKEQAAAPEPVPEKEPEEVHAAAAPPAAKPAYWTDFRGPNRDGVYSQMKILTNWPGGKLEQLWKQPVGGGYASFVVADGLAFTIEQRKAQEVVAAYDTETGREVWTHRYDADFHESMGGPGPRATPTWHAGKVFSLGAEGHLVVLDAKSGKVVWAVNILSDNNADNVTWAMSASPLVVDNLVVVQPGGPQGKSIVAYDKNTGKRVWGSLGDKTAYASPILGTLNGQRQIIAVTALRVVGLNPADGKMLWEYPWKTDYDVNSSQAIIAGPNQFVISAGYGHGAALAEVAPDGSTKTIWQNNKLKTKFSTAVLYDGYLYGLDEAILACVDVKTGEQKWKGGRYGYGQLVLADGHLIITSEQGDVALVKATPEKHEELARFQAIEGKTWNAPALAEGKLFVRNTREMAAFRISPATR